MEEELSLLDRFLLYVLAPTISIGALYFVYCLVAGMSFTRSIHTAETICHVTDGVTIVEQVTDDHGTISGSSSRKVDVRCDLRNAGKAGAPQSGANVAYLGYGSWEHPHYFADEANRLPVKTGDYYTCTAEWSVRNLPFVAIDPSIDSDDVGIKDCHYHQKR